MSHENARSIITGGSDVAALPEVDVDTEDEIEEETGLSSSKGSRWMLWPGLVIIAIVVVALMASGGNATGVGKLVHLNPEALGMPPSAISPPKGSPIGLSQELLQLFEEETNTEDENREDEVLLLEHLAMPTGDEPTLERQRVLAALEIDRILASQHIDDILGEGTERERQQEFHRVARLLHPDKGLVSSDDQRASLALRLSFAARRRHK